MKALLNFAPSIVLVYNSKYTGSLEVKESLDQDAKDFSFLSYSTLDNSVYALKAYQCFYRYPYLIYSCPEIFLQCFISEIEFILQTNIGQSAAESFEVDLKERPEGFIEWLGFILDHYGYANLSDAYNDMSYIRSCATGCIDNLFKYANSIETMQFAIITEEDIEVSTIPLPLNISVDLGTMILDTYLFLLSKAGEYSNTLAFADTLKCNYIAAWQANRQQEHVDSFEGNSLSQINAYIQQLGSTSLRAVNDMLVDSDLVSVVHNDKGLSHAVISLTTFKEIQSVRGIHNYLKNYDYLDVVITPTRAMSLSLYLSDRPIRFEVEWGHFLDQISALISGDFKIYDKQVSKYITLHAEVTA